MADDMSIHIDEKMMKDKLGTYGRRAKAKTSIRNITLIHHLPDIRVDPLRQDEEESEKQDPEIAPNK